MAKRQNVVKMSRSHNLNIGVVIFLIIIIYVVFNVFSYLTSSPIAEYEVGQGTIATNHIYQGLIIRDETVVYAGQSGYINYYMKNASKASVNDVIYSIDTTGDISKQITTASEDGSSLNTQVLSNISSEIDAFRNSYDPNAFSSVYNFKNEMDAQISQTLSVNALASLVDVVDSAEANKTFYKKKSEKPGVIVYYTDGYENVTTDNFTSNNFTDTYSKKTLSSNAKVASNDPAYKRINSESWNIILPINDDMIKQLDEDNPYIKIRFCKDDYSLTVPYTLVKKDGTYYLNLSLKTAMVRYVNDRFVDVELVLSEDTGLKIPTSSITSKEFYTVPKEYFTTGGDSNAPCLLVEEKKGDKKSVNLVTPTIYYEKDDNYYIDDEFVTAGDVIAKTDSTKTYTIGNDVIKLTGVYNINKGYAVFKQINILTKNEDYAIIETKTTYGISLYDHIALDGSKVKENQLVIK